MSPEKAVSAQPAHDAFTESRQVALVCVDAPEHRSLITTALQELGFTVHAIEKGPEAAEWMRKMSCQVIVVDEAFQSSPGQDNPVLQGIQSMMMPVRRHIFVAVLGKQVKTFDHMAAFARSVNAVVSINDLPKIKGILRQGITENDEFYKVFRDVLREAGRR